MTANSDFLSTAETAAMLHKKPRTLQDWRLRRRYHDELPHYRIGKDCFYRRADVLRFLESCKVGGS